MDILVPDEFMVKRYPELRVLIEGLGYRLTNEGDTDSQDFEKDGEKIAFAKVSALSDIPKFRMETLILLEIGGVRFKSLSPNHYLDLYKYLQTCDYRIKNGKAEKDKLKVAAIRNNLTNAEKI